MSRSGMRGVRVTDGEDVSVGGDGAGRGVEKDGWPVSAVPCVGLRLFGPRTSFINIHNGSISPAEREIILWPLHGGSSGYRPIGRRGCRNHGRRDGTNECLSWSGRGSELCSVVPDYLATRVDFCVIFDQPTSSPDLRAGSRSELQNMPLPLTVQITSVDRSLANGTDRLVCGPSARYRSFNVENLPDPDFSAYTKDLRTRLLSASLVMTYFCIQIFFV